MTLFTKFTVLTLSVLALTACKGQEVSGSLDVAAPLTIQGKGNQTLTLLPGKYVGYIAEQGRKTLFDLKNIVSHESIRFTLPSKKLIGLSQIAVSAEEIGQNFSIQGALSHESNDIGCTRYYHSNIKLQMISADSETVLAQGEFKQSFTVHICYTPPSNDSSGSYEPPSSSYDPPGSSYDPGGGHHHEPNPPRYHDDGNHSPEPGRENERRP